MYNTFMYIYVKEECMCTYVKLSHLRHSWPPHEFYYPGLVYTGPWNLYTSKYLHVHVWILKYVVIIIIWICEYKVDFNGLITFSFTIMWYSLLLVHELIQIGLSWGSQTVVSSSCNPLTQWTLKGFNTFLL